ncbi:hydantoinase/oxoprolinase family protein [Pseudomonas citronellolis]|uniref:hydantoinase/oxoprolinase family protein n=1 Tax=Pseudomonas citronellolis TaxID=53408 RepID=UPI0023E3DFD2|nr:hydantoinase/oxoprolinase family protein [Pseudomonas citronellolis]MDF3934539.1 hydantoinase/oxoprolinase family protein [Pseudomonas citronellolis]
MNSRRPTSASPPTAASRSLPSSPELAAGVAHAHSRQEPPLRIGIDVGGTNTDAVLMRGREVLHALKRPTTDAVGDGVAAAVDELLRCAGVAPAAIAAVMLGTTQFLNALLQRRHLARVAVVRLALPSGDGVPPLLGWPRELRAAIGEQVYLANGGARFDGQSYSELDVDQLRRIAESISERGVEALVLSSTFAPLRPDIEKAALDVFRRTLGERVQVTLSSEVGGIGLLERENAAILNASLQPLAQRVVADLLQAFRGLALQAPLYISENDGTLMTPRMAARFPILTCAAGPTNSLRGAAFLSGVEDALVVDVGGTTTDVGVLLRGLPRQSANPQELGGVRCSLRRPDGLSVALGGGTLVHLEGEAPCLGPDSLGLDIRQHARVFGGDRLCATDIAVAAQGLTGIGDARHLAGLDPALVRWAMAAMVGSVERAIDGMRSSAAAVPVVLVGGGAVLLPMQLQGASAVLRPAHAEVANAVGAAVAQVSGRVDRLFDMHPGNRDDVLEQARQEAREAAVWAGADPGSVSIVEVSELPMTHLHTGATRVQVRAVGDLALAALAP